MTATDENTASAMPTMKVSSHCSEVMAPSWRLEDHRNTSSAGSSRTATPRISHKKSSFKSKLLKLGSLKREVSTSDSSSITTSSTLDDTSDSHSAAAAAASALMRHLPADRQPLLPPRSPLQQKQILESLQKQFFPQHLLPTPTALACPRVGDDAERFMGPIDLDTVNSDDGVEIVESVSDLTSATHAMASDVTTTTIVVPTANGALAMDDSQELDRFLRRWQSGISHGPQHHIPAVASPVAPVDVDAYLSEVDFQPEDYEEFVLDEVELCRELAGYQEGCEPEWITDCSLMTWNEEDEDADQGIRKGTSRPSTSAATANSKSTPGLKPKRPTALPHPPSGSAPLRRPPQATFSRSLVHPPVPRMYQTSSLPASAAEV